MPVSLADYQFCLDTLPEIPFGVGRPIVVQTFDPSGFEVRDQDADAPTGDATLFGIDRHTPPVWTWEMYTGPDSRTAATALSLVDSLQGVWEADDIRAVAGSVVALRYAVGGRTRRVYGRPRRFNAPPDLIQHGRMKIVADFKLAETVSYDDLEESALPIGMDATTITGTGFAFPIIFPLFTAAIPPPRAGQAVIRGTAPTWVTIDITGPVLNPFVQVGDRRYALTGAIDAGETITVSGRSWDQGIYSSTGYYRPDMLDPRSRLSQLRFKPGIYTVSFGGQDQTGSARARVRWRNAYRSM